MQRTSIKHRRWQKRAVVAGLIIAGVCLAMVWRGAQNSFFVSAERVNRLKVPADIIGRDGGGSVLLGGKLLWLFGDTFYNPKGMGGRPESDVWRSATSSLANRNDPFGAAEQPRDSQGNPVQVIPLNDEEQAYNRTQNDPQDRYTIWPTGQIAFNDTTALLYYMRFLSSKKNTGSTGVAILRSGQNTAQRLPNSLFSQSEPQFRKPLVKDGYVYLYATDCNKQCEVARVPLAEATNRQSYRFWDGSVWSADVSTAKPVITDSNYGYDVMWSEALNRYIQISIGNLSNQAYLSYATQPQGPWSSPKKAFKLPGKTTYVPYFHPHLSDGETVYMTYNNTEGIDVMRLTFRAP